MKKEEAKRESLAEAEARLTRKCLRRRPHSTGLVDLDYWMQVLELQPRQDDPEFRRGCIWA